MACSTILEMKARLLTGLKLGFISCKLTFFMSSLTKAVFHLVLKSPLLSEALTILVIRGQAVGSILFRMLVAMSSSSHVLVFICLIISAVSFSVNGVNFLSKGTDVSVIASYCSIPLNSSLICKILSWKNLANLPLDLLFCCELATVFVLLMSE